MKTMAEVIHTRHCLERVHNEDCMFWVEDHESAAALAAAGYGPVKEAQAEAWDNGRLAGSGLSVVSALLRTNPYRTEPEP